MEQKHCNEIYRVYIEFVNKPRCWNYLDTYDSYKVALSSIVSYEKSSGLKISRSKVQKINSRRPNEVLHEQTICYRYNRKT